MVLLLPNKKRMMGTCPLDPNPKLLIPIKTTICIHIMITRQQLKTHNQMILNMTTLLKWKEWIGSQDLIHSQCSQILHSWEWTMTAWILHLHHRSLGLIIQAMTEEALIYHKWLIQVLREVSLTTITLKMMVTTMMKVTNLVMHCSKSRVKTTGNDKTPMWETQHKNYSKRLSNLILIIGQMKNLK